MSRLKLCLLAVLAIAVLVSFASPAEASTVYVGSCGTHDYPTGNIQTAVSGAVSGDAIIVCAGNYRQNVNVETSGLTITTQGTVTLSRLIKRVPNRPGSP